MQRAQSRKKEIRSAAHVDELRNVRDPPAYAFLVWNREAAVAWTSGDRRGIADRRIVLLAQAGELAVHRPGVLDEFELTRQVRIEADEVQTSLRLVCGLGSQRFDRRQLRTVFAAAAQNPMESNRRHQIVA